MSVFLSESGREFHVDGVAQANERPPKVVSLNLVDLE